jgi:ferritin-like metal-binding protein YciE
MATKAPKKTKRDEQAGEHPASTTKLVQYLTEAHGKERELETSLQAHIQMASRDAYKKRLQQHLKETKQHAKLLERRLKQLGGPGLIAGLASGVASKALPAAKGPLHALRGSSEAEKQLKNAKTEYSEEHEEIATYTAIETLAEEVGDDETAKLARGIRREEERMASFLEKQISVLTKEVVKAEIPASERKTGGSRRRRSSSKKRSGGSSGSGSKRAASSRGGSKRSAGSKRSSGSSGRRTSSGSGSKSGTRSRSGARS